MPSLCRLSGRRRGRRSLDDEILGGRERIAQGSRVVEALRQLGYDAQHVREIGLKGRPDAEIIAYARRGRLSFITLDEDFANLHYYPLGTHAGIWSCSPTGVRCMSCSMYADGHQKPDSRDKAARRAEIDI